MLVRILVAIFIFSLSCSNVMAAWLVTDPNGTLSVSDVQPISGQIHAGATVLQLPSNYSQSQLPYMQSDGHGNAVYVAPTPPTPPVIPNVLGFIGAIRSDSSVTNNPLLIFELGSILAIFQADMMGMQASGNPATLQADYANAITLYGPSGSLGTWLSTGVQSMLRGYAASYNIPLVP